MSGRILQQDHHQTAATTGTPVSPGRQRCAVRRHGRLHRVHARHASHRHSSSMWWNDPPQVRAQDHQFPATQLYGQHSGTRYRGREAVIVTGFCSEPCILASRRSARAPTSFHARYGRICWARIHSLSPDRQTGAASRKDNPRSEHDRIELRDEIIAPVPVMVIKARLPSLQAPGAARCGDDRSARPPRVETKTPRSRHQASVGEGFHRPARYHAEHSEPAAARGVSAITLNGSDGALVTTMAIRLPAGRSQRSDRAPGAKEQEDKIGWAKA